jgi:ubiquinone/menaquinone biosynthesis C-methylase UbiE
MSDMNRSFSGSMPEFYDRFLVPELFEPFARDLAGRLQGMFSGQVLEIAAGTGVVTRALARILPSAVRITATDLNPAMLEQAKSHAGLERVLWQEADALALPFPDQMFDRVVCQFGVMFFPDKQAAFREVLRVLKPGGQFLFNVWGDAAGTVRQEASRMVAQLLARDQATLRAPAYNDIAAVRAELVVAGFTSATAEKLTERGYSSSAREAAIANCHGGLLRAHIETHAPDRLDEITDAVAAAIAACFGNGPIDAPLYAILFEANRPVR